MLGFFFLVNGTDFDIQYEKSFNKGSVLGEGGIIFLNFFWWVLEFGGSI